jgi:hypothetical protein
MAVQLTRIDGSRFQETESLSFRLLTAAGRVHCREKRNGLARPQFSRHSEASGTDCRLPNDNPFAFGEMGSREIAACAPELKDFISKDTTGCRACDKLVTGWIDYQIKARQISDLRQMVTDGSMD